MELQIYEETDELMTALAELIVNTSQKAIAERGQFNFVLSGGSSPRKLYELLASESFKNRIGWKQTYFFFGDERFVPDSDPQRNSLMARQVLLDPLNIPEDHIFTINATIPPKESARQYFEAIQTHFNEGLITFDFVLLGLGDNAHTASLFPLSSALGECTATIISVFIKELDMYRITMSAPMINQSRQIAFVVFGNDKAQAIFNVLGSDGSVDQYPAKLISPKDGELYWFLDLQASILLKSTI